MAIYITWESIPKYLRKMIKHSSKYIINNILRYITDDDGSISGALVYATFQSDL